MSHMGQESGLELRAASFRWSPELAVVRTSKNSRSRRCSFRYWRRNPCRRPIFRMAHCRIRMENRLPNTCRINGGVASAFSCACSSPADSGVAPEPLSKTVRGRSDFWILYGSSFLLSGSLFMAFVFMADFVSSESVDGSAAVLLGIIGISSVVGRLLLGILGARMPVQRLLLLSSVGLSVSFGVWATVGSSYLGLIVFSILLGISRRDHCISPAVVAHLFGTLGMGGVLGALYTARPRRPHRTSSAWGFDRLLWLLIRTDNCRVT